MNKIRMNQAEATQIQEVADRLAERTSERFVLDRNRVEIVEDRRDTETVARPSSNGLNVR